MIILVGDVEWDIFRTHRVLASHVQLDLKEVAASKPVSYVLETAINLASRFLDDATQVHAAQTGKVIEQEIFQSNLRSAGWNLYLNALTHDFNCKYSRRYGLLVRSENGPIRSILSE